MLARALLWAALALPAAWLTAAWGRGALFYGEYLHRTGDIAVKLLILAMAATPLARLFGGRRWTDWLLRRRREFGLACFGYALLHTLAYLLRQPPARVLEEGLAPPVGSGWLALLVLLPLALTSNDLSLRLLRRAWRRLHRMVYGAAALVFLHWVLTAFDPTAAWWHLAALAALEAARLARPTPRRAG